MKQEGAVAGLSPAALERARLASRQSLQLTVLGTLLVALALGTAAWRLRKGGEKAIEQTEQLVHATEQVKQAQVQATQFAEYLDGKRPAVAVGDAPAWVSQVSPEVHYDNVRWRYRFNFSLKVPPEHRDELASVQFQVDPATYGDTAVLGTGPDFSASLEVDNCRSNATALLTLRDGRTAKLGFDWCGLSKWSANVHYDNKGLGNVNGYASNCVSSKALLVFVPEAHLDRVDRLQLLRQVYRADRRWQPAGGRSRVTFVAQHSTRNPTSVGIVAKCDKASVCVDLAAAYFAAAGGMRPELHCGDIPLLTREEAPLPGVLDDLAADASERATYVESCYRLSACEVATSGRTADFPISACLKATVPKPTVQCAKQQTCDQVLECAVTKPAER